MIPLKKYLLDKLNESGGGYQSTTPFLGAAGVTQLAEQVAGYFIGRELTDSEFENYNSAIRFLGRHTVGQQLIRIVKLNHQEYESTLARFSNEYTADYMLDWGRVRDMVIEVNRHVLNFLAAMRTFLDHTETRLKREESGFPERLAAFKRVSGEAFDNHFSYRFIYKLRNYTQHCGMPLGVIRANSALETPPTGPTTHSIDFFFEKASLLANFDDWGKHVQPDLERMPETFPLSEHLSETMGCLEKIQVAVMSGTATEVESHLAVMDALLSEVDSSLGTPCVYTALQIGVNKDGQAVGNTSLQRFHMQHIEEARSFLQDYSSEEPGTPE